MSHSESPTGAGKTAQARIWVIDDQADQGFVIQKALQQVFDSPLLTRVDSADQARLQLSQALDYGDRLPHLILLDLYLPDRAMGYGLLETIRSLPAPVGHLPLIMLSYSADSEDIRQAYEKGATSYLVKPTDFSAWLSCFQTLQEYWWQTVLLPSHPALR